MRIRGFDIVWGDFYFEVEISDPAKWMASAGKIIDGQMDTEYDVNTDVVVLASDLLGKEMESVERVKRRGQSLIRDDLLRRDRACAISGETFAAVLDAAHISGAAEGGAAHWNNCILLRADLHRLYDAGKLKISPTGVVTLTGAPADTQTMYAKARPAKLNPAVLERVAGALAAKAALEAK